jgi:protocatechuate 3,4-dioxygenase beta subunit
MKFRSLFVVVILSAVWASAVDLTVSPDSVAWTDQGWIDISITNITPAASVGLFLYLDVDGDGTIDGSDFPITFFGVKDGNLNEVGAETLVDDKDGLTNGAIETAISCHGVAYDTLHTVGDYIWQAVEVDETFTPVASTTAVFSVTQAVSSVSITGEVRDYVTQELKPGSYVEAGYFSDTIGLSPSVWADENGAFTLYIPEGVATNAVVGVQASSKGMMSAEFDPDTAEEISMHYFTNALSNGENVLADPLYTVPAYEPDDLYTVSGTVYLIEQGESGPETNTLSGVFVETETEEDVDTFSWDVTDENGHFSLVSPSDDQFAFSFMCDNELLSLRGIVGAFTQVVVTNTTAGVEIYCYEAEALARARVTDKETGEPLAGVEVRYESTDGSGFVSSGYTLTNGFYEIGLRAGTYQAVCDEDSLKYRHYVRPQGSNDLVIAQDTVVTNTSFEVEPGYLVTGHVYDTNGVPLTDGSVVLFDNVGGGEYWIDDEDTSFSGLYNLLAPVGTVYLRTTDFGEYVVDLAYSNRYVGSISSVDALTMTTNGLSDVDFYLPYGARIEGTVVDHDMNPVHGLLVEVFSQDQAGDWNFVGADRTDWDGSYSFAVPAGTNIKFRADVDIGLSSPRTWYGDVCSHDLATSIALTNFITTGGLDIQIFPGYQVHGSVLNQAGLTGIAGATVTAYDENLHEYSDTVTDESGNYEGLFVPTNIPLAFFADAEGFEGELNGDIYNPADAIGVQTSAYSYVSIPFVLYASDTDRDDDGLADFQEDTIPDGVYNSADDYADRGNSDTDEDGVTDGSEWVAGTNPQSANSFFEIVDGGTALEGAFFVWSSVPGRDYIVQERTNLLSGIWSNIYTVTATADITAYTNDVTQGRGYYRVRVSAP